MASLNNEPPWGFIGYCPRCGALGNQRGRNFDGTMFDICVRGHRYSSTEARRDQILIGHLDCSDEELKKALDVPGEIETTLGDTLRDSWRELLPRLVQGQKDYGDGSLREPLSKLLDEIDKELLDVMGWAVIGRRKVAKLRERVTLLEERIAHMERAANPPYVITPDGQFKPLDEKGTGGA